MITLAFFAVALALSPRIIRWAGNVKLARIPENYEAAFMLLMLVFSVVLAGVLGINVVFAAFLGGIAISSMRNARFGKVKEQIKQFSFAFFIPAYFAIVGLRLDLIHHLDLGFFLGFLLFAFAVQGISVFFAALLLGYTAKSSANLSFAMNARGGPGIVLATVSFDVGIISENFFVSLILLALVTSAIAGAWLRFAVRGKGELLEQE